MVTNTDAVKKLSFQEMQPPLFQKYVAQSHIVEIKKVESKT